MSEFEKDEFLLDEPDVEGEGLTEEEVEEEEEEGEDLGLDEEEL